ncbi:MAG: ribosome rescue GTPase HflX, partial [Pseudoalteromonas distincta]
MFDRYESGEQAILVHIDLPKEGDREDLHELEMLVSSAGVSSLAVVQGSRQAPHPKL